MIRARGVECGLLVDVGDEDERLYAGRPQRGEAGGRLRGEDEFGHATQAIGRAGSAREAVDEAPTPCLAGLERAHDGVGSVAEVSARVCTRG